MSKIRSIFSILLLLGLVTAEFLPNLYTPEARSNPIPNMEATRDNLMSSIVSNYMDLDYEIPDRSKASTFVDFNLPAPSDLSGDTMSIVELSSYATSEFSKGSTPMSSYTPVPAPTSILNNVVPPFGSPLYYAYQDGARAWYSKGTSVLAIYPDDRISSFSSATGMRSDWLKRELLYEPVDDANAIENYTKNYRAVTVAETTRWVLMEFPSGGVAKVIKPEFASSNQKTTGTTIGGTSNGNLPSILPGYSY